MEITGKETYGFNPFLDMLNHGDDHNVEWSYDNVKGGMSLVCNKDMKNGDEVITTYGVKNNQTFLINYGFSMPKNVENSLLLVMEASDV